MVVVVAGVLAAAIAGGAPAGSAPFSLTARSRDAAVASYLRSAGIDPRGVVIQRGARNYAGSSCPGRTWNCTTARRAVQIATAGGSNTFTCTARPTGTSSITSNGSTECSIVQSAPASGNNEAKCIEVAGPSQSCSIEQTNVSGDNNANIQQTILTSTGSTQSAAQNAKVKQTNQTGGNAASITQSTTLSSNTATPQSQSSNQTYSTQQTSQTGMNTSSASQSVGESETTPSMTGSQYQAASLDGHVDQLSSGISQSKNKQTENQTENAPAGSSVTQTQFGPFRCCSSQGTNPADTFKLIQSSTQSALLGGSNNPAATQANDMAMTFQTSGSSTGSESVTNNSGTTTNSGSGSTLNGGLACTNTCTQTSGARFPSGDIFVSVDDGKVQERHADGTLVQTLDTGKGTGVFTAGMAFDALGNLYVTDFNANDVSKFPAGGTTPSSFGSGYNSRPESIVFDKAANAYVGQATGTSDILKFNSSGAPAGSFSAATEIRGTDWLDLAPDQCTLFYTSEGTSVKRFDACANSQGTDFATGLTGSAAFQVRLLPDGGALVADSGSIVRLNASGASVQTYDVTGEDNWFALALDPDGTSFWAADPGTSDVVEFNIATGAVERSFNTGTPVGTVFGVAVAP